jgi:ABC transporter substrate binding protein
VIEWRFADGKVERLPELAEELVRLKPDAILATLTPVTRAIQQAIPVVMGTIADPVGSGFIKSLARPEGNITGLTNVLVDISPKHLEILLSVVPKLSRVAVLANPGNSSNIKTIVSPPSSSLTASSLNSLVKRVRLRPGLNLFHLLAHLTPPQVLSTFKSVHGNRDASVWPHLRTVLCHDCFCHCFQHIDESKSSGG